uniref:Protein phosphatase 1G n=1 Tax=Tetraodon nigroviridis TaxID=99883 RepID=H3C4C2_TETNG
MGAYLSQPNITKGSSDGGNSNLSYGLSAMQGWRVSMEDAHNCILDFDEDTAMFAVYDGHGGEEVALYCSKYLPDIIKEQKTYKDGKLQKALEDAFLAIDSRITTEEVIKELIQIAGRPTEELPSEKMAEEDDLETEEAALLHEEATMTIEELLARYGQNLNAVNAAAKKAAGSQAESPGHKVPKEGVNGEVEEEEEPSGRAEDGPGAASGSRPRVARTPEAGEAGGPGEPGPSDGDGWGGLRNTLRCRAHCGGSGGSNGQENCSKAEGDAGKEAGDTKLKFFEDSEESEEGEEEGSDEEMCLPGMDGKEEPGSDSGTTAVVALIRGKQLIVANAGDSRCVVSERGKAVDMSYDHKPEDEVELARIKNAGGKVTMDGRVNGGLNLSRAIGDHFYKRNRLPPEEQMISAMPDVKVLTLNEDHDFMVIACDGIWNVLSSQEVVDFIGERIKADESGHVRPLSSVVEELLDHCLAPDTSGDGTGCDNMTCVIITLRPHPSAPGPEDPKKRKHQGEAGLTEEPEENGNDSKKAKSD